MKGCLVSLNVLLSPWSRPSPHCLKMYCQKTLAPHQETEKMAGSWFASWSPCLLSMRKRIRDSSRDPFFDSRTSRRGDPVWLPWEFRPRGKEFQRWGSCHGNRKVTATDVWHGLLWRQIILSWRGAGDSDTRCTLSKTQENSTNDLISLPKIWLRKKKKSNGREAPRWEAPKAACLSFCVGSSLGSCLVQVSGKKQIYPCVTWIVMQHLMVSRDYCSF